MSDAQTGSQDAGGTGGTRRHGESRPEGMRRHEEPTYGYAIDVPAVFVALMNTVDPVARMLRQLDELELDEESKLTGSWPVGFADPEVIGDLGGDHTEPLRLLEFDVLERAEPMSEAELAQMRERMREAMPEAIASRQLSRFKFLVTHEVKLGDIDALGFEYEWAGPSQRNKKLRDRGLVVWAPTPTAVYQVYYHCPVAGVGRVAAGAREDAGVVRAHRSGASRSRVLARRTRRPRPEAATVRAVARRPAPEGASGGTDAAGVVH